MTTHPSSTSWQLSLIIREKLYLGSILISPLLLISAVNTITGWAFRMPAPQALLFPWCFPLTSSAIPTGARLITLMERSGIPFSTHVAGDSGADLIFASHTHQPFHLPESKGSLVDFGLPAIIIQSIYLLVEQKINNHSFNKNAHGEAIDAVSQYCKTEGISDRQRNDLCEILQEKLNYSPGVHTIYIHPESDDQAMFFGEHFSLSPKKMTEIVKSGFRATIQTLKRYEFADRIAKTAIGVV